MLDAADKKFFAQFDDPAAGQRVNALELWREHLKKAGRTFRDIVEDIETAIPAQRYRELQSRYDALEAQATQYAQANAGLVRRYQVARGQLAAFKGMLSIRRYWRGATVCLAAPVIALAAWEYYTGEPAADRAATDAGFQWIASATPYVSTDHDSEPVVRLVAGASYWIIVRRSEETGHNDSNGRAVTVQCVRLFAEKAESDAGVYLAPKPYAFGGWGWLTWPERGTDCRTEAARRAAK